VAALRVLHWAGTPISGREVARRARLSTRGAQDALADLEAVGVVIALAGGRDRLVSPNRRHALWPAVAECFRAEAALYGELRAAIAGVLGDCPGVMCAVLFGSVARAQERPESDCDVLLIGKTPRTADDAMAVVLSHVDAWRAHFGVRVAPVGWGVAAARAAAAAKASPWREAQRDAVLLVGRPLSEVLA
jgi:predicted nucleotidyltransferase